MGTDGCTSKLQNQIKRCPSLPKRGLRERLKHLGGNEGEKKRGGDGERLGEEVMER